MLRTCLLRIWRDNYDNIKGELATGVRIIILPLFDGEPELQSNGQVKYRTFDGSGNERTTSLTKMVLYAQRKLKLDPIPNQDQFQKLQDAVVEWAATNITADAYQFRFVDGKDIVEGYANGPKSCMKGKKGQLELYVRNPEKVKLAIISKDGKDVGRALLWTADDGTKFLDRVYPGNGMVAYAARQYATEQGWAYKKYDGIGGACTVDDLTVTLRHPLNARIPYLDSLSALRALDTETITLGIQNNVGNNRYTTIGDYEGTCGIYSSNVKFLDGGLAPFPYNLNTARTYRAIDICYWRPNYNHQFIAYSIQFSQRTVKDRALRKNDMIFCCNDKFWHPDTVVPFEGSWYFKWDLRKVRNEDRYVPKRNVKKYRITEIIQGEDGNGFIHNMEEEA